MGNVLAVVSDLKLGMESGTADTVADFYVADVRSLTDYWPFGAPLQERQFVADQYRFGFNGKEADPKWMGVGVAIDYGFRVHDARVGRFLSVDPLRAQYPMLTTYQYASNSPVWMIDVDGLEGGVATEAESANETSYGLDGTSQGSIPNYNVSGPEFSAQRSNADPAWKKFARDFAEIPGAWDGYVEAIFRAKVDAYTETEPWLPEGIYWSPTAPNHLLPPRSPSEEMIERFRVEAEAEAMPSLKMAWATMQAEGSFPFENITRSYYRALTVSDDDEGWELVTEIGIKVGIEWGMAMPTLRLTSGSRPLSPPTNSIGSSNPNSVSFIVSPNGTAYPVPRGATGPTPVINQFGNQTGVAFTGGRGGANGSVSTIRLMDPTTPRGRSPGYPNGYIKYENAARQGVDPHTGRTISRSQAHYPIQ